jgi:hypothetical protein
MSGLNNDTKYAILTKTPAPEKSMSIKFFLHIVHCRGKEHRKKVF